jgi:hypothetical protein
MSVDPSTLGPILAHRDRPRLDESRRLAVIADPHLAASGHGTWKLRHRSEQRLRTALAVAQGNLANVPPADAVVFAGDQTNDGRRAEFDIVDGLRADLDRPWTAIPGNHDVPKTFDDHDGVDLSTLRQRYLGAAEGIAGDSGSPNSYPFVLRVGGLRVVCLNTAAPPGENYRETWGGAVGTEQLARLETVLNTDRAQATIVVAHHNLGALPEHEPAPPWSRFPADDAAAVRAVLQAADVPLAVTAHHHVPAVRTHDGFTELMAPAVCSFPQAMLSLRIGPDGTTVRLVPLAGAPGVRESYWAAVNGKPLGSEIAALVADRLPLRETASGDDYRSVKRGCRSP